MLLTFPCALRSSFFFCFENNKKKKEFVSKVYAVVCIGSFLLQSVPSGFKRRKSYSIAVHIANAAEEIIEKRKPCVTFVL